MNLVKLMNLNVPYKALFMRNTGDNTPDETLKRNWLIGYPLIMERVLFIIDDRQKIVDMWRREGFTCFQVAPGNF